MANSRTFSISSISSSPSILLLPCPSFHSQATIWHYVASYLGLIWNRNGILSYQSSHLGLTVDIQMAFAQMGECSQWVITLCTHHAIWDRISRLILPPQDAQSMPCPAHPYLAVGLPPTSRVHIFQILALPEVLHKRQNLQGSTIQDKFCNTCPDIRRIMMLAGVLSCPVVPRRKPPRNYDSPFLYYD